MVAVGAACVPASAAPAPVQPVPGTIIVDASEFYHQIPRYDTIADEQTLGGETWVFNNTALVLRATDAAVARIDVPAASAGPYHLHVRSQGREGSSFKLSVAGAASAEIFGTAAMAWKDAGTFDLKAGSLEIRLTDITPSPALDVLVFTKTAQLDEAAIRAAQYPAEVMLAKSYTVPPVHAVKFGDLTGDGRMDFVALRRDYSAFAFDHDGKQLWQYDAPVANTRQRAEFEAPGTVWDFDGDGRAEVVHWRELEGREWIVMADGVTGAIKHRIEWPSKPWPHVYNNFRTAVAKFGPGRAEHLVVLCDSGGVSVVAAYDRELKERWRWAQELRKDHLGHYVYPIDVTGDGIDEVIVGHLCLDASGREVWNNLGVFPDHHDHADSYRFADLDGDGGLEAIAGVSDVGTVAFDARTGAIKWMRRSDHTQQLTWGNFLADAPAPQVVVNGRIYGNRALREPYLSAIVYFFAPTGGIGSLAQWPANPLNGNPDFVKGDWRGDGREELFWFKFHFNPDGAGTLFFAEEVYHMFDFLGNGAEQVIALNKGRGLLQIYGYRDIRARPAKRDAEYLRHSVANHTHY